MPLFFRPRRPLLRGAMIGGGSDMVEPLTKLKGLLDAGALTQEEFQTAKQRLLAGA